MSINQEKLGFTASIVNKFLTSNLSVMFIMVSLVVGVMALWITPREEEPQITVPMADIFISMPGSTPEEIESLAAAKLEKLLMEVDGVENVYMIAQQGGAVVTVQFFVGEDRERSLVKLCNKIQSNLDLIPPGVSGWVVKPIEVDDVPIINVTFYSETYNDFDLRRIAEETQYAIQEIPSVGRTYISGGRKRQIKIILDTSRMTAYHITPGEIAGSLKAANINFPAGTILNNNQVAVVDAGKYVLSAAELSRIVVGIANQKPVYLSDVAAVEDGPEEVKSYTWMGFGSAHGHGEHAHIDEQLYPAVTLAIAKKKGKNAVTAAEEIIRMGNNMRSTLIPDGVEIAITRNYGDTANEKVNELVIHLLIAVFTVIVLIAVMLGSREALIVALAVPMTLAFTLIGDTFVGYTINRVTLFALILSLGLLVDDPIVDVENIHRHFQLKKHPPLKATLIAVDEVRPPTILATFTVIISFIPMFFVTGMMGPYMRPMPFNVPLAMIMSLVVAFTVTPWATYHMLKHEYGKEEKPYDIRNSMVYKMYRRTMEPLLRTKTASSVFLFVVFLLFVISVLLALLGYVPMKMLPYDNKNELQLIIDMPQGTSLERTDQVTRAYADFLRRIPEVENFQIYTGATSPFDFNGLVRHYYLRSLPHQADIRINMVDKHHRMMKSHAIALRIREDIERIAEKYAANVKIVESPPGPPVLATAVAEIITGPWTTLPELHAVTKQVRDIFENTDGVYDVDDFIDDGQTKYEFKIDKEKVMLHGLTPEMVAQNITIATGGYNAGNLHIDGERNPLVLNLQLPLHQRSTINTITELRVKSFDGSMIPLSELVTVEETTVPKTIYHKNSRRTQFVTGDILGVSPYKVIMKMQKEMNNKNLPPGVEINWRGEGEWKITLDVFRDLGLAFLGALVGIYILLIIQTHSITMPLVIMVAIPLTMIGIMPGFFFLNLLFAHPVADINNPIFFTATGMIGMIALAGIVVRNSIILIDFIERSMKEEHSTLKEAVILAGAVRFRPILLTAGAAMLGSWVIALDPIFSGLAWSFIFGIFASTAFTLLVIPVIYYLMHQKQSAAAE